MAKDDRPAVAPRMPGHLIRRLHQVSTRVFGQRLKAAGIDLTPIQFAALDALRAHPGIDQAGLAEAVAKDRVVGDAKALQKGIDAVPEGTTHCMSITTGDKNSAEVEITETHPDGTELVHDQTVTTTRDGDRVVIETIKENK